MMLQTYRLQTVAILLLMLASAALLAAEPDTDSLLNGRLSDYKRLYPEIDFIKLHRYSSMNTGELPQRLGEQVQNIDYQHPEDMRDKLVKAQLHRIDYMVENSLPSATLFYSTQKAKPYTCVISLDPSLYSGDKYAATEFLFNLHPSEYTSLKEEYVISNEQFAMFVLEHEVFHCLYSYQNGYTFAQTMNEIEAKYNEYYIKSLSDLYARMMHETRYPNEKHFLKAIKHAKVVNITSWDVSHYTINAFKPKLFKAKLKDDKRRVEYIINNGSQHMYSYVDFKQAMASAYHLIRANFNPAFQLPEDMAGVAYIVPNHEIHMEMVDEVNTTLSALFDRESL